MFLSRAPTFREGPKQSPEPHVLCYARNVVDAECVVRYDNEVGKDDHRHFGTTEARYRFRTPETLIADFQNDIARWNDENSGS